MSLPIHFDNPITYFEHALKFFSTHQHLFNFMNTDALALQIIQNIDISNIEHIDIYHDNFRLLDAVNNKAIEVFLDECNILGRNVHGFIKVDNLERDIDAPLGPKKKHEIAYLAEEIDLICKETGCSTVVDFGSGLGYLDQQIYKKSNLQVLGLECNKQRCSESKSRQNKYHKNSKHNVNFRTHTVTEISDRFITKSLEQSFNFSGNICLTGLHACADLTITAMKLFIKMADAKALVIMPCCYHKMNLDYTNNEQPVFYNFPLSESLKSVLDKFKGHEFLRIPFLRLATQPPSTGEKLKDLVFNLLVRNIIQVYSYKYDLRIKRRKRKTVKPNNHELNIDTYLQNIDEKFYLLCKDDIENKQCDCNLKFNIEEIKHLWKTECNDILLKKAAIFVLQQRHLQAVFENFILFDRLVYLHENGFSKSYFKKIVDEKISPKCLALVITK